MGSNTANESGRSRIVSILNRQAPGRIAFAPNLWQWFAHHRNHGLLPWEIRHCQTQLDVIRHLGLDVFSRNIYCDEQRRWFGGLADTAWGSVATHSSAGWENGDRVIRNRYETRFGPLEERLRYDFAQSTLVQEKFLIEDGETQLDALEDLLQNRCWVFDSAKYASVSDDVGSDGVAVAGELHSPLKMLHLLAGPVAATYLLADYPERMQQLLALHEQKQLDLVRQMAGAGVKAMMSMDNLDTMFHPPHYVEKYSASFYEKAAAICHHKGAVFFIHACGKQKDNLSLISSLGVDGLEGVAFPKLGDVELDEAMGLTGDRFLITGGISAQETKHLHTSKEVFAYTKDLLDRMEPYANRFMLSASCNTSIETSWDTIKRFRDAWLEYGDIR